MSGLNRIDRGTPRKYHNKTSSDSGDGPLTETERQDSNSNEPVGALISVDTDNIRIRVDGGSPSQSDGHQLEAGDILELYSNQEVRNLEWASAASATPGELHITLYY